MWKRRRRRAEVSPQSEWEGGSVRFTLNSGDDQPLTVYMEPWGNEHVLGAGDTLEVTTPETAHALEVVHLEGAIALWFASEDFRAVTRSGRVFTA